MVIRILVLDQARTTGYAVFENGKLADYGAIELGKKDEIYESFLYSAKQKIHDLINKTQAEFVVIEDIQQQNQNVKTYKKLAMLMGLLISLFQEMNKTYVIIPPSKWKAHCGIKGKRREEQKENTLLFAKERYGLENITEDMADAISLGTYVVDTLIY